MHQDERWAKDGSQTWPDYSQALSKRRAEAAARLLIEAGLPADRVFTVSRGPDVPIADNKSREGQSRNRRVEIDVKTTGAVEKVHRETGVVEAPAPATPNRKPTKADRKSKS